MMCFVSPDDDTPYTRMPFFAVLCPVLSLARRYLTYNAEEGAGGGGVLGAATTTHVRTETKPPAFTLNTHVNFTLNTRNTMVCSHLLTPSHVERPMLDSKLYPPISTFRPISLPFAPSPPFAPLSRFHTTEANVVAGQAKPGRGGAAEASRDGQPQARGAAGRGAQRGEEYDGGRV